LGALTAAAFYGKIDMVSFLLAQGTDPNGYPERSGGFHQHATPLHQAVYSGSLDVVKLLVEAGASLKAKDKVYEGTPLGWAEYVPTEEGYDDTAKQRFALIADYLRAEAEVRK
jgi:peptide-methionine (S)-S-oxide reductase